MPQSTNNRSLTYGIAVATQRCAHCAKLTPVVGLLLPAGHETLGADADEDAPEGVWEISDAEAMLFFIEYLPEAAHQRLRKFSRHYRLEYSEQAKQSCWMNHCCECGMAQGELELYCEPEGAFVPISAEAAASVRLYYLMEPIEARAAGYAYAPEFLESVSRPDGCK